MCSLHVLFIRRLGSTNYQSYLLKILRFDFKRNIILIYHERVDIFPYLYTKARRYECSLKLAINTQSSYLFSFFFKIYSSFKHKVIIKLLKKLYIFLNIMHSFFFLLRTYLTKYTLNIYYKLRWNSEYFII